MNAVVQGFDIIRTEINKAWYTLLNRQASYRRVFGYENGKLGLDGEIVMRDLVKFCRGCESTFHQDPRAHAMLEGRREVLLRIAQHLNLPFNDLWAIYDGRETNQ